MSNRAKADREQEQAHATHKLRQALESAQSGLWVRTEQGSGAANYLHLYVVDRGGRLQSVSYYAARAAGDFSSLERGWKIVHGTGEDAASAAYRAAGLPYSPLGSYAEFK